MKVFENIRKKPALSVGIFLLLALSILEITNYLASSAQLWNPSEMGHDEAAQWSQRLLPLRADLPLHGVVGYFSNPNGSVESNLNETLAYAWTQYSLAPLVIQKNTHLALVIGNLPEGITPEQTKRLGLKLIFNYGWGIYLFQGALK
jgi:hypothetical protein